MAITKQRIAVIKNAFLVTVRGPDVKKADVANHEIYKVSGATTPDDAAEQIRGELPGYEVRSVERFSRLKDAA